MSAAMNSSNSLCTTMTRKSKCKQQQQQQQQQDENVIRVMVESLGESSVCLVVHPLWNYHSYQQLTFFSKWFSSSRVCLTCQQSLRMFSEKEVVKCLGCGLYAHRSCAFQQGAKKQQVQALLCKVHYPIVQSILQPQQQQQQQQQHNNLNRDDVEMSLNKVQTRDTTNEISTHVLNSESIIDLRRIISNDNDNNNNINDTNDTTKEENEGDETTRFLVESSTFDEQNRSILSDMESLSTTTTVNNNHVNTNNDIVSNTRIITAAMESFSQYCYSTGTKAVSGVSFTGSVVGGVAGLAVAGPAGAIIGSQLGKAACVLTVLYQGRKVILIGAGLFAAGMSVKAAVESQQQQQPQNINNTNNNNYHLLTLDDDDDAISDNNNNNKTSSDSHTNSSSKLVLIRPNVVIDHPSWEKVISHVTQSYDANIRSTSTTSSRAEDSDIFEATELDTEEKVLLLVSRNLNDKTSLPGYMFRCLIEEHGKRVEDRRHQQQQQQQQQKNGNVMMTSAVTKNISDNNGNEDDDDDYSNVNHHDEVDDCTTTTSIYHTTTTSRETRQDAHAVILYVTNAFLTVTTTLPCIRTCQHFIDTAKDSVELVVLSEIYQSIWDEIVTEVALKDNSLTAKIEEFEGLSFSNYSKDAVETLSSVAQCHSALAKLEIFVTFLEHISTMYSADSSTTSIINADSLLTLVCRHILLAKVPNLNAHVAFAEEFAKDEHLLRGKSGYALVTMQASLHILNEFTSLDCFFLP